MIESELAHYEKKSYNFFILITHPLYSQIQSVSLAGGNTPSHRINIPEGQVLEVIDFKTVEGSFPGSLILNSSVTLSEKVFIGSTSSTASTRRVFVKFIPGPAFLDVVCAQGGTSSEYATYFSYRIHDNSPTPTQLPSNSVVIPSDANGNVRVVLESSVDMVNWTEALPGTYGASTAKRFFRIRVVNQ
jgi:hypothetical protein